MLLVSFGTWKNASENPKQNGIKKIMLLILATKQNKAIKYIPQVSSTKAALGNIIVLVHRSAFYGVSQFQELMRPLEQRNAFQPYLVIRISRIITMTSKKRLPRRVLSVASAVHLQELIFLISTNELLTLTGKQKNGLVVILKFYSYRTKIHQKMSPKMSLVSLFLSTFKEML